MEKQVENPVMLYTEQTPNPESLKFVLNRMLYPEGTADFREESDAKEWSPLATALFEMPYVKGVYISANFVTITKQFNYEWTDVMLQAKQFIKKYVEEGHSIIKEGYQSHKDEIDKTFYENEDDAEAAVKIKDLIEQYVKPAVQADGGNIEFQSYKDGVVHVLMQGACSGCPSSSVTLKSGIEGMLKRMVPTVKEVVAVME